MLLLEDFISASQNFSSFPYAFMDRAVDSYVHYCVHNHSQTMEQLDQHNFLY